MAGIPVRPEDFIALLREKFGELEKRIATLERPSGTNVSSLVAQVQAALANITTTVTNAIQTLSYTKAQIDSKVASPGDISPGNVNASGSISTAGSVTANNSTFISTYARNNQVTTNYVTAYINSDGKFLATASSKRFKREIESYDGGDWRRIRAVTYKLRSAWILDNIAGGDGSAVESELGVIAEELVAAGYPELVVFDSRGKPWSVHYERIGIIAISAAQELDQTISDLAERVTALEG